jgi:hypothetical protein
MPGWWRVRKSERFTPNRPEGAGPSSTIGGVDHVTVAAGVPAPFPVPESLLELLARHEPALAEQIRRPRDAPPPDAVLVLGGAERAVGQLTAALAARVPARLRCAPAEVSARHARLAETRAAVWVFDAGGPPPPAHWVRLAALAGQVEEVHLAVAGTGAALVAELRDRLAEVVPRLADAPVYPLADGPDRLVAALSRPADQPGHRNALRILETGLARAQHRRVVRQRRAARREQVTGQALAREGDDLADDIRELYLDGRRGLRADLAEVRQSTSVELAGALRTLRDDARQRLGQADRAGRASFPEQFRAAATELARRVVDRMEGGWAAAARAIGVPGWPRPELPVITLPGRSNRSALEDRIMVLAGAYGGLWLGRLALSSVADAPSALDGVATPTAVGLGVGAAWWLARVRRAVADRARLERWMAEVLADLRTGLEAMLTERALVAERQLVPLLNRRLEDRRAALSARRDEHDRLTRRVAARRAELSSADGRCVDELTAARAELAGLLTEPSKPCGLPSESAEPTVRSEVTG